MSVSIAIGSIVTLKSGGPRMTVSRILRNKAQCYFFDQHLLDDGDEYKPGQMIYGDWHSCVFPVAVLMVVDNEEQ